MEKLYQLKERLIDEIEGYADVGKLTKDDALELKALTGAVDHLCNIIESGGSSNRSYRGSSRRYSRDGYSRHGFAEELRVLMDEAPDEHTRQEIKRLIDRM